MPGEVFDGEIVILDASEAMSLVQLPIIEEQFGILRTQIETAVQQALALECTESTYKEVKKARAELNKQFQQNYENARKQIKAQVLAPYNLFEGLYKQNITEAFTEADRLLAEKIGKVEGELKDRKRAEVSAYFDEYKASIGLSDEPFKWEDAGIAVNLSSSVKGLKESAKLYLDNVKTDLACIRSHPYADEVMAEYHECHNLASAIYTVETRHEAIEKEKERAEVLRAKMEAQESHEAEIAKIAEEEGQAFSSPVVKDEPEEDPIEYEVTFRVRGTLDEIIMLKRFLEEKNMTWNQIAD